MSAAEFWDGDPYLAAVYRQKHNYDIENRNQELWLQGYYIHNAISANLQNAFAKKGGRTHKYLEKPIRITPMTKIEKQIEAARERKRIINYFRRFEKAWKKKQSEERDAAGQSDNRDRSDV
jgi:hypothetical protein